MGSCFRFTGLIILFLIIGCKEDSTLDSSLWFYFNYDNNDYEEILILNKGVDFVIFAITFDGIKPSKSLSKLKENKYVIDDNENLVLTIDKDKATLSTYEENRVFEKLYEIKNSDKYLYSQDSFHIRYYSLSGDTSAFLYKTSQ